MSNHTTRAQRIIARQDKMYARVDALARQSPGQRAYELDCAMRPLYHDGTPRKTWQQLSRAVQDSWERNPTVDTPTSKE